MILLLLDTHTIHCSSPYISAQFLGHIKQNDTTITLIAASCATIASGSSPALPLTARWSCFDDVIRPSLRGQIMKPSCRHQNLGCLQVISHMLLPKNTKKDPLGRNQAYLAFFISTVLKIPERCGGHRNAQPSLRLSSDIRNKTPSLFIPIDTWLASGLSDERTIHRFSTFPASTQPSSLSTNGSAIRVTRSQSQGRYVGEGMNTNKNHK